MSGLEYQQIALVGFGEAASAFVEGWGARVRNIQAYDIKVQSPDTNVRTDKLLDFDRSGVIGCAALEGALDQAEVIFSLVTADQAEVVATEVASYIVPGALFLDCNSCSPGAKRLNQAKIEGAGGRYVDLAIMAPVHPKLHHTPVSVCGAHGAAAMAVLESLDMKVTLVEGDVGAASSIKMIRSIMMKGLEALFAECVLAGREAGVDQVVLASLDKTYPGFNFAEKANYMLERSMTHGIRRAAEMREVARTVEELGLGNDMTRATVEWQQRLGDLKLTALDGETYQKRAERVLAALQAVSPQGMTNV